jgi:hypothetical protein
MQKLLLAASAAFLFASSAPAFADELEVRLHEMHTNCERGDRGACVRFGIALGQHPERLEAWRRGHADWFWWDRR